MANKYKPEKCINNIKLPSPKVFDMVYVLAGLEKCFNRLPLVIKVEHLYRRHSSGRNVGNKHGVLETSFTGKSSYHNMPQPFHYWEFEYIYTTINLFPVFLFNGLGNVGSSDG